MAIWLYGYMALCLDMVIQLILWMDGVGCRADWLVTSLRKILSAAKAAGHKGWWVMIEMAHETECGA